MDLKERILTEAEALFWKYGIRSITMDDIARQVNISKKTIYQHFIDKEDIVYQVISNYTDRDKIIVDYNKKPTIDPIKELLTMSETLRDQLAKINPALLIDLQRHYPRAWQLCQEYKEKYVLEAIRQNLKQGVFQNVYRSEIDIDIMARLRMELVQLAFNDQVFPLSYSSMFNVQAQLLQHFIRGILTEKGFSIYNQLLIQYANESTSISK
ncbi:TetR/AcrR family transcriptional regulator [Tellurirhabdus bombi]|uniref:TetR/AcrR family transcriptional regulator n=1 Tax=Tellurirhabdus bombi TaxID=2907205 RepID=UPI001F42F646|nr:TetR/AcrR family transcriptional regulator [Tellurirhabdus bombi]